MSVVVQESDSRWLVCSHCQHGWNYRGRREYYCTCPNCRYKVRVAAYKEGGAARRHGKQRQRREEKNSANMTSDTSARSRKTKVMTP